MTSVIGREAEGIAIGQWLGGPRPSALLLAGAAGIGKTTLWEQAAHQAHADGDVVLRWRACAAERELAFAVLTALCDRPEFAGCLDTLAPPRGAALAAAFGRSASVQPPTTDLIGLAVADLLRALATDRRVLVAIDDLQWTDEPSAQALAFAVRRLHDARVGLLATWRADGRDDANRLGLPFERLDIGPLRVAALGRAARATAPGPGEPFPVPADTGALARDHLALLSPEANRAVLLVAMSPHPRLDVVTRILGPAGAAAIDEAWANGILEAEGHRLRPRHPLFASIAHDAAPPMQREMLRQALADHAEDVVERAVHLCALSAPPDPAILSEAGLLAMARCAPGVAASLFERAGLFLRAAEASVAAGDLDRAEAHLGTLLELVPSGKERATALLALGELVYVQRPNEALPLLLEALSNAQGDPLLEALAHSYICSIADMEPTVGHRSAERAAEILEQQPDPDPEHLACALLDRAFHCLLRGEPPSEVDVNRALRLRTGSGTSYVARRAQEVAQRSLVHLGRFDDARAIDEQEHRRLTDPGQFGLLPPLTQAISGLAQVSGDWTAARRYAQECQDLVEQGERSWAERAALAMARIHAWEGDLDTAPRPERGVHGLRQARCPRVGRTCRSRARQGCRPAAGVRGPA